MALLADRGRHRAPFVPGLIIRRHRGTHRAHHRVPRPGLRHHRSDHWRADGMPRYSLEHRTGRLRFPRPTQPPKDALAQLSAACGCDLRSRVRRFESCRRLGPALLWTPGVIFNSREPHVIRPGSAQCPARVAGRLVPYVTDPRRADLRVARRVLLCCLSSPLRVVRCEHRTSLQMDMDPPAGPDRNRLPMFTLTQ